MDMDVIYFMFWYMAIISIVKGDGVPIKNQNKIKKFNLISSLSVFVLFCFFQIGNLLG